MAFRCLFHQKIELNEDMNQFPVENYPPPHLPPPPHPPAIQTPVVVHNVSQDENKLKQIQLTKYEIESIDDGLIKGNFGTGVKYMFGSISFYFRNSLWGVTLIETLIQVGIVFLYVGGLAFCGFLLIVAILVAASAGDGSLSAFGAAIVTSFYVFSYVGFFLVSMIFVLAITIVNYASFDMYRRLALKIEALMRGEKFPLLGKCGPCEETLLFSICIFIILMIENFILQVVSDFLVILVYIPVVGWILLVIIIAAIYGITCAVNSYAYVFVAKKDYVGWLGFTFNTFGVTLGFALACSLLYCVPFIGLFTQFFAVIAASKIIYHYHHLKPVAQIHFVMPQQGPVQNYSGTVPVQVQPNLPPPVTIPSSSTQPGYAQPVVVPKNEVPYNLPHGNVIVYD